MNAEYKDSIRFLRNKINIKTDIGLILGSGLGKFTDSLESKISISYSEIPNYFSSNVKGHDGMFVFGASSGKNVVALKGRIHMYEGYSENNIARQIKVLDGLGVKYLIITNSAGSLIKENPPGTFLIINGHIDATFRKNSLKPSIVSSAKYYSKRLISIAKNVFIEKKIRFDSGIYCWTLGPSYETPDEIRYFKKVKGSAVGMSTVPEIKEGGRLGMELLTISTLTNYAAGINKAKLSHNEVLSNANQASPLFIGSLKEIIRRI